MNSNTSRHVVYCDGQNVRETDTVQEAIAFSTRLKLEAQEVGLKLECRVEEEEDAQ